MIILIEMVFQCSLDDFLVYVFIFKIEVIYSLIFQMKKLENKY